jgi:hypothetical protein
MTCLMSPPRGQPKVLRPVAYRRGFILEKRRKLMTAWGCYCDPKAAHVVALQKSGGGSA